MSKVLSELRKIEASLERAVLKQGSDKKSITTVAEKVNKDLKKLKDTLEELKKTTEASIENYNSGRSQLYFHKSGDPMTPEAAKKLGDTMESLEQLDKVYAPKMCSDINDAVAVLNRDLDSFESSIKHRLKS